MVAWSVELPELSDTFASSLTWRGKPSLAPIWSLRWKRVRWIQPLSARMIASFHTGSFVIALADYLRAIPANPRAARDSRRGRRTNGGDGPTYGAQLLVSDLTGVSSRTSPDTLPEGLATSCKTWGAYVLDMRRDCLRRRKEALRTRGSASSSWPTPTVLDSSATCNATASRANPNSKHHGGTTLTDAIRMWPTPRASDGEKGGPGARGSKGDPMLPSAVLMWPTPMAKGWRTGFSGRTRSDRPGKSKGDLCDRVAEIDGRPVRESPNSHGKRHAQLNPDWVAQLMGLDPAWINCDSLEMVSSPLRPSTPSGTCGASSSEGR